MAKQVLQPLEGHRSGLLGDLQGNYAQDGRGQLEQVAFQVLLWVHAHSPSCEQSRAFLWVGLDISGIQIGKMALKAMRQTAARGELMVADLAQLARGMARHKMP